MRSSASRAAAMILAGLMAVGCSATPSPSPLATSSPSAVSTTPPTSTPPSPSPTGQVGAAVGGLGAGQDHTCAITTYDRVKCWGRNDVGQLGDGTTADRSSPVEVSGLPGGIRAIAAGGAHTCVLTAGGRVACWGANHIGQLGDRTTTNRTTAVDVPDVSSVIAIAAGSQHTCALISDGGVKCWGSNYTGELGTTQLGGGPFDVEGLPGRVVGIAAGDGHTCALTSVGGVKCWGMGGFGELGNGTNGDSAAPVDVVGLESGVTAIAAGGRNTCAIATGQVKCWGETWYDEFVPATGGSNVPVDVAGMGGVIAVTVGSGHSCALLDGGPVRCWGGGRYGQLGHLLTTGSTDPVDARGLGGRVVAIAGGGGHTCAAYDGGAVACVGDNWYGQLGTRTDCSSSSLAVAVAVEQGAVNPLPSPQPTRTPGAPIEHLTGPSDVILQFDHFPDVGVSDLGGEVFQPGAEFTLYGDGTVLFRDEIGELPPPEGSILRAHPFKIAKLSQEQVQSALRFALEDGGLEGACDRYEFRGDLDGFVDKVHTARVGGLDKRVVGGPLEDLSNYLRNFDDASGIPAAVFVADRYMGNLLDSAPYVPGQLLPDPKTTGTVRWPWPGVTPADFIGLEEYRSGRRVMSAAEAAVLGISDGGVIKRVYLVAPDGKTIYSFSMWPVLPGDGS
jgi:alpha-tubulin suppressor-like RCC1 family protein